MELLVSPGSVTANFSAHEMPTTGDPRVLRNTQPLHLHYNFTQNGPFFGIGWPVNTFEWSVRAMFEVYGPTESVADYRTVIPFVNGNPNSYVGALTIPQANLPDDCVCRIIVQLSLQIAGGGTILGTGFQDMGIWQFYG